MWYKILIIIPFISDMNLIQMPLTTPFPGPRSVLVLDNARIHHGPEVEDLAAEFGVFLIIEYILHLIGCYRCAH